ncbi:protein tramtrack, beta isoform-like isoform X4 [Zophobas morio]|uniref:protein tramtrack, beta isoform-like isoform X4 n=1 Tax=Zophobas morio TaxID=2755281 RepID=UPI003083389A
MASEQFSLCWDNFHKNMSSGMNSLLENEDLVDVTLAVEGKYLKAHKMVLSVCSPYFRELFKMNPCKHPIVFMKDVSYIAMSDLLQFMYQGEVQVSQDNLTTFIKTAEALQIKGLTGDGNGSAECDNDQDEPRPAEIEPPKMTAPPPRPKKVHQTPTPPAKRPRLSVPEQASAQQTIAKTEPAAVSSAPSNENLIQFKMEPYDQGQSTVTIPDDNTDETFTDDPLDETNADDGNEDYSMMEGGDEEPQAGTSADGTAGEGQGRRPLKPKKITEMLEHLVALSSTILLYVKSMDARLRSLETKDVKQAEDLVMIENRLPIRSIEALQQFEIELAFNEDFKSKFASYIKVIGGRHGKDNINRILKRVYSNELGVKCSWLGQRQNYRVCDLLNIKLVKDEVLKVHGLKELDFESYASEWFRLSKLRLQREEGPKE